MDAIEEYPKGWGRELWIVNTNGYCGKILEFDAGKRCSWHYHLLKDETFYLQEGCIELVISWEDDIKKANRVMLHPGDKYHIPQGLRHQMIALETSKLFEFSTTHYESDSYRIIKGN
jgi:mannose-6-phosphate isomerase-like protein (cupin superfamily)